MRVFLVALVMCIGCTTVYTQNSYTSIPCAFRSDIYTIECGTLKVPQSRQTDSGTIDLAVVIIHSRAETPAPDPIVYLTGGPGGSITAYTENVIQGWFAPFLEQRDLILIDQRGTGRSEPVLTCDEYTLAFLNQLSSPEIGEVIIADDMAALSACHNRLTDEGIVTSAYTSAESAADLSDLRLALGLESWNLLGVSYGTRLALTILRDHPQGVRSVILDSVYPPQVNLYTTLYDNIERARLAVFEACAQDEICAQTYPKLEERFWGLVKRLNEQPREATIQIGDHSLDFVWTGNRLYDVVFLWMYQRSDIAMIPYYIDLLWQGRFDDEGLLTAALDAHASSFYLSMGMYMSVQCGEERPATLEKERRALLSAYPQLSDVLSEDLWLSEKGDAICRVWQPQPPSALENEPVTSDVPVLLLSGSLDPITPPAWADLAAETLSQSQSVLVPQVGHGAIVSSACATQIALAYLDQPTQTLETGCLLESPPLQFYGAFQAEVESL